MILPYFRKLRLRAGWTAAFGLAVLALSVRLYGLSWGLPGVFEEATPLTRAWEMWGWGQRAFDPNPHFFNYPSFIFYLHFAGQAILFGILRLTGSIHSSADFVVRYVTDPTPFYIMGRGITTLFATGTVLLTFLVGRRAGGMPSAILAGLLLAINPMHIAASQVVDVDVPLTFFAMLTLWRALDLADHEPGLRRSLETGVAMGLAVSTKYTGALLILPLTLAHVLAGSRINPRWAVWPDARDGVGVSVPQHLLRVLPVYLACVAAALLTFALTSPYVFLDWGTFQNNLLSEKMHMQLGHFGSTTEPAWRFYLLAMGRRALSWPGFLLAGAGVLTAVLKREKWALIAGVFLLSYLVVIFSWRMKADRYLLPALPILLVLAWAWPGRIPERHRFRIPRLAGAALAGTLAIGVGTFTFVQNTSYLDRMKSNTRAMARQWIEAHLPAGSFIVTELQGPEPIDPLTLVTLGHNVRSALQSSWPTYAVQTLPMDEGKPELSSPFYDIELYGMADVLITSSLVRGRYAANPGLFRAQTAFYDSLEKTFRKVKEFRPGTEAAGPVITIYKNPATREPFARRKTVPRAPILRQTEPGSTGREAMFYYTLGLNYEYFGHPAEAVEAYAMGCRYPTRQPRLFSNMVLGAARCLLAGGQKQAAETLMEHALQVAPSEADRSVIREMAKRISGSYPGGG